MGHRPLRVLLADDSAHVRRRVAEMLAETRAVEVVAEAADTAEALRLFALCRPDAAIIDLHMPGGGAIPLLPRLRAEHPAALLVVLTAFGGEFLESRCLEAGANCFLTKQRDVERLLEVVSGHRSVR